MHSLTTELLIEIGYAVGIGLFVGLEREHSEVEDEQDDGSSSAAFGARTDGDKLTSDFAVSATVDTLPDLRRFP